MHRSRSALIITALGAPTSVAGAARTRTPCAVVTFWSASPLLHRGRHAGRGCDHRGGGTRGGISAMNETRPGSTARPGGASKTMQHGARDPFYLADARQVHRRRYCRPTTVPLCARDKYVAPLTVSRRDVYQLLLERCDSIIIKILNFAMLFETYVQLKL